MKKYSCAFVLLLFSTTIMAQNIGDALRLSNYRIQGTARSTAMGNAIGALGGDFTSASINPAGLGIYRSSEFVLTPSFSSSNVDGTYLTTKTSASKNHFGIPNIGYVAHFNTGPNNHSSLVDFSVGFGYNRMTNFNINETVRGDGATSSLLDGFTLNSDNTNSSQLDSYYEGLAYNVGLIYPYSNDSLVYASDLQKNPYTDDFTNYPHSQQKRYEHKGSIEEYLISVGLDFNHKLYLGATLGIQDVYFKAYEDLNEYNIDYQNSDLSDFLNEYAFNTYYKTVGTGINLKLGAIYRPTASLRLGLAIHTPTWYNLEDDYQNYAYSDLTLDGKEGTYNSTSPYGQYDYNLRTPMRGYLSAAYIFGKSGLVSVDYEYVDYNNMKFTDGEDGYSFSPENQDISDYYKSVGNWHIGAEYRVSPQFSLRGGYEYFPSPYKDNVDGNYQPNSDNTDWSYSFGFGYQQGAFFLDAAYKRTIQKNNESLYSVPDGVNTPWAKFSNKTDYMALTMGFRF